MTKTKKLLKLIKNSTGHFFKIKKNVKGLILIGLIFKYV